MGRSNIEVPSIYKEVHDLGEEVPEADRAYAMKCLYEGTIYEDGSQWKATHEACKMCSCQRGIIDIYLPT